MASGQPPFFYHILMNPSSPHLPLPAKFVKKHLRNKILKKPILKSANGGYLWKLKMKKFDDHTFCFVDGWCKVVKDVGLLFGEFLLINNFKVVDDEVSVFEEDDDDVEDEVEEDDDDVEYDVEEDDEDVAEEDEEEDDDDVELGDDDDDDDGEDEDDVDVDGDDGDPFFVITSSKRNKNKL
ncbi:DNA-binding pseudobarrel domain-containing protein, partial [Tanacetum coccineum]